MITSPTNLRHALVLAAAAAVLALDVHLIGPYVSQAASALGDPALTWVAIALAAEIASLFALAHQQRRMLLAAGTRVPMRTAVGVTYAAYAMSMSLPAGPAVSAGYTFRRLRQLGATTPAAGFTLLSSGVLSTLAYGLVAIAGFAVAGGASGGPVAVLVGLLAGALLVALTRSLLGRPDLLERAGLFGLRVINRVLHRAPDAGMQELRGATSTLTSIHPRGRDWAAGLTAALINWLADLICLFAAGKAVGANGATIGVVLLAYLGGTSVSSIALVPGGLGVVDAALIVILVQNGVGTAPAAAAVLLYRTLSFGFGVVVGWSAWIGHAVAARRAPEHAALEHVPSRYGPSTIRSNHDHHALLRTAHEQESLGSRAA